MRQILWITSIVVTLFSAITYGETLSYTDLIGRLTDLERLAVLPAPGENCGQWSSYDRASQYNTATEQYQRWEANGDGEGIIRKEGNRLVLAEMTGPGCIWRIWSAMPKEGHILFYLDGSETPAIDIPFAGLFNRKVEPFTRPALAHETAKGQNCYIPIPYQKSCKIVVEGEWGRFYHFTYATYPKDTIVPTFSMKLSAEESAALDKADEILTKCGSPLEAMAQKTVTIEPGESFTAEMDGPAAVTAFRVKIDAEGRDEQIRALREIVLQITWDDEKSPAVWAPLGDFFGTAPGINLYKSFPMGMTDEGFYCNWYMPFDTHTRWEFINEGDKPRTLSLESVYEPLTRPIEQFGRFHAKWHRDAFVPADPKRWPDWMILLTQGRGRFCGVALNIWHPRGGPCSEVEWCKGHYWWGEGDEKFFVDGEKFPSTFGTGTEDYFGYAWGNSTLFANAYHNQTLSNNNKGHISVNRWQISDNVPFQTSFEGAIEKYFPNHWPTQFDATVYWYQAAGQSDPYQPVPLSERVNYWAEPKTFRVPGVMEGEDLAIIGKSAGNPRPQDMAGHGDVWSGRTQLWWTDAKPNDMLDLAVAVDKDATYRIVARMTKAVDYGVVQLRLDGKELGGPIDLYNDGVVLMPEFELGTLPLTKGRHVLQVKVVGANDKAVKNYMFGLDYLKLEAKSQ